MPPTLPHSPPTPTPDHRVGASGAGLSLTARRGVGAGEAATEEEARAEVLPVPRECVIVRYSDGETQVYHPAWLKADGGAQEVQAAVNAVREES